MSEIVDIFKVLSELNIPYEKQEHKAIFSEEDSKDVVITLEGTDVKNLFVKDKKKILDHAVDFYKNLSTAIRRGFRDQLGISSQTMSGHLILLK